MKNFLEKFYANAWGRLTRRFVVVGISSVVGYLVATGKLTVTPEGLVDSVLKLNSADAVLAVKLFIGSGFLAAIDKMRREGTWTWFTDEEKAAKPSVENAGGEQ